MLVEIENDLSFSLGCHYEFQGILSYKSDLIVRLLMTMTPTGYSIILAPTAAIAYMSRSRTSCLECETSRGRLHRAERLHWPPGCPQKPIS